MSAGRLVDDPDYVRIARLVYVEHKLSQVRGAIDEVRERIGEQATNEWAYRLLIATPEQVRELKEHVLAQSRQHPG